MSGECAERMSHPCAVNSSQNVAEHSNYLFWVLLLMPIDWFAPSGALFREFGAKPATMLLTIGGLYALLTLRSTSSYQARREFFASAILIIINCVNILAFSFNNVFGWSEVPNARSPFFQFVSHSILIVLASLAIVGNARIFYKINAEKAMIVLFPRVALFHIIVWLLEVIFPTVVQPMLALFRSGGVMLDRASGLMSEPSYFGAMSAIFGIPILLTQQFRGNWFAKILALSLLVSAMYINAKTMILVAGVQVLFLVFVAKRGRLLSLLLFFCIGASATYVIQSRSALDLEENMSSAMRLGSAHLAANVALSGFALTGIGAGQFHFLYTEQYAPSYLLLSNEAVDQMQQHTDSRASTYNFPLRVMIEIGVFGFVVLFGSLIFLVRARGDHSSIAKLMLLGSLAFLMTQDTYFYPPLILSCSLLLSARGVSK